MMSKNNPYSYTTLPEQCVLALWKTLNLSLNLTLQARIAFLQGERKGQENLKNDLVRRIKMLEYALKQERAKYAKLKYGGDSGQAIVAASALDATRYV